MTHIFNDDWEAVLNALESGEYEQCTGKLHDGKGYCCLGVMCQVLLGDPENCTTDEGHPHFQWADSAGYAPTSVVHRLGLRTYAGGLYDAELNGRNALADANDTGATFAEIAAFIRDKPDAVSTDWRAKE